MGHKISFTSTMNKKELQAQAEELYDAIYVLYSHFDELQRQTDTQYIEQAECLKMLVLCDDIKTEAGLNEVRELYKKFIEPYEDN